MKHLPLFIAVCTLSLAACQTRTEGTDDDTLADSTAMTDTPTMATVQLMGTEDSTITGQITFTAEGTGVRAQGTIEGLTAGMHGFHLHQNASCEAADSDDPDSDPEPAGAAGPHWDPMSTNNHAGPDSTASMRHAGDLGNITADADGRATVDAMLASVTIEGMNGVANHALVVHSGEDDLTTDPSGNSGSRIACGVVQVDGSGMMDGTDMNDGMMSDTSATSM